MLAAAGCTAAARQAVAQAGKYPRDLIKEDVDRWAALRHGRLSTGRRHGEPSRRDPESKVDRK
jgi:hypothetical protein